MRIDREQRVRDYTLRHFALTSVVTVAAVLAECPVLGVSLGIVALFLNAPLTLVVLPILGAALAACSSVRFLLVPVMPFALILTPFVVWANSRLWAFMILAAVEWWEGRHGACRVEF